jgi:hypothetical protein
MSRAGDTERERRCWSAEPAVPVALPTLVRPTALREPQASAPSNERVLGTSFCDGVGICQKHASRLMTSRLRAALSEQDIDIFAAGNLGVRRDETVVQLALAHDRARLIESLSKVSRVPQCRIEERVTEIGPFYLVLAAE